MTAINFPAAPATGATHTEAGITWTFDGTVWDSKVADVFVNTTGDTMTGNLTVPSLNGGQLAGFRNQLINGAFDISQRGTTFTHGAAAAIAYTLDRWCTGGNPTNPITVKQFPITNGLPFANVVEFQAADAGTWLGQPIELPAAGKPGPFKVGSKWTCSVWSNVAVKDLILQWKTSSVALSGTAAAGVVPFVATSETEAGYTKYTATATITSAPGATDASLTCHLMMNPGTTYLSGVQLEPGPVATPFEHRSYGQELALCQRYYQRIRVDFSDNGSAAATKFYLTTVNFPTIMRTSPSQRDTGPGVSPLNIASIAPTTPAGDFQSYDHCVYKCIASGGPSMQGDRVFLLDAEL